MGSVFVSGRGVASVPNTLAKNRSWSARFRTATVGDDFALGLLEDGSLWSWGNNASGQLGDGTTTTRLASSPSQVPLGGVELVVSGGLHSLALLEDGSLWAWGANQDGQLGNGSTQGRGRPSLVSVKGQPLEGVRAIAAGRCHCLALKADGSLWTWGRNQEGQLGDGTTSNRSVPARVLTGVRAIAAGSCCCHSFALREDGSLWAWGANEEGQLGDGTVTKRPLPAPVRILPGLQAVAAGRFHSLALREDGSLWAWGRNSDGRLGDGTTSGARRIPCRVLDSVRSAAAGGSHSLVVKEDGSLWAFGANNSGQLGQGAGCPSPAMSAPPVLVMKGVREVSAGLLQSVSLREDGSIWGWGGRPAGAWGTTPSFSDRPMRVATDGNACVLNEASEQIRLSRQRSQDGIEGEEDKAEHEEGDQGKQEAEAANMEEEKELGKEAESGTPEQPPPRTSVGSSATAGAKMTLRCVQRLSGHGHSKAEFQRMREDHCEDYFDDDDDNY
eukprot:TRINITY_DN15841_c0_g1_i2.p1 TRINITY_DN15841_c0_g1~~TRINITY_DN15841_c0_g1_i2.p1  ORF type:complete len:500 (+),score=76.00 TRINITY_DN15841_c0_g1_i2:248-1747(+)